MQNDFSSDFAKWIDTTRTALELAIAERDALAAQLSAFEKIEADRETEQIEMERRVIRAVGNGKTEAGHLRQYVADRRREIPSLESPRIRECLKNMDWKIADLRLTLKQIGDAAVGRDVDAEEVARTIPTPAEPAPAPEIIDDPAFDIIMPAPTWRAPLSDRPVVDLVEVQQ